MKIEFVPKTFRAETLRIINIANEIIEEWRGQGYDLTLRQLYYQFVARVEIENTEKQYKRLGTIVSDGRLAGLIDWDAITDRTRTICSSSHYDSIHEVLETAKEAYFVDKWEGQGYRPEVWIEKDALSGVISGVCQDNDVPYFSCRGYVSQSAMYRAACRIDDYSMQGQKPVIIHLGDHDPSGIDMTRDIKDRLVLLSENCPDFAVDRIALNMSQIEELNPPPNPTKLKDSRSSRYISEYGSESWELDAIKPAQLSELVQDTIDSYKNYELWDEQVEKENAGKEKIREFIERADIDE